LSWLECSLHPMPGKEPRFGKATRPSSASRTARRPRFLRKPLMQGRLHPREDAAGCAVQRKGTSRTSTQPESPSTNPGPPNREASQERTREQKREGAPPPKEAEPRVSNGRTPWRSGLNHRAKVSPRRRYQTITPPSSKKALLERTSVLGAGTAG